MRFSHVLLVLPSACLAIRYNFSPEQALTYIDSDLPTQYSLPDTQLKLTPSTSDWFLNSYWYASYLTASNDRQYVLLSNALVGPSGGVTFRASLLDIANPDVYYTYIKTLPLRGNTTVQNGQFNIEANGFAIKGLSEDNIAEMASWGSTEDFQYNLTFKATTRAILNSGTGFFAWGSGNTTQWSLPSCQTTGILMLNGLLLKIDAQNSLTWHDRQLGPGSVDGGFTWFGIQFPGSNIKASVWFSDNNPPHEQHLRFATVRTDNGLEVVRFKLTTGLADQWTSPDSHVTYHTKWLLEFANGEFLEIETIRKDQEIYGEGEYFLVSGFATVKGRFYGQENGFALVDIQPPTVI